MAVDIVPAMLGFSLGGMAILLAFSSARLLRAIRQGGRVDSLFMKTVTAFFHFILLQTSALLVALIAKAYGYIAISGFAFFLMAYAILTAIAVAGLLVNVSQIFNAIAPLDDKKTD